MGVKTSRWKRFRALLFPDDALVLAESGICDVPFLGVILFLMITRYPFSEKNMGKNDLLFLHLPIDISDSENVESLRRNAISLSGNYKPFYGLGTPV